MNTENLHELINRYTADYYRINDSKHDEIFKWRAVKHFQTVWFSEKAEAMPFAELFRVAKKECGVLFDHAIMSPGNGVIKLAEQKPVEVEHLFREVLFSDDDGDLTVRQNNMDRFLGAMEELRQEVFPRNWKYKQDRHSVSCYMSLFAPEKNNIYRYSNVDEFSRYTEFGLDIGRGAYFSLADYHTMCDRVVEALQEHNDLLEMHFNLVDDSCYHDKSLHIMAFDLLYCALTYGYYTGLEYKVKEKKSKPYIADGLERNERDEEKRAIEESIKELKAQCEQYETISLCGVEVFSPEHGKGQISFHEIDRITVKYAECAKQYVVNRKYTMRPTFEDDEGIVDAITEYATVLNRIDRLEKELQLL